MGAIYRRLLSALSHFTKVVFLGACTVMYVVISGVGASAAISQGFRAHNADLNVGALVSLVGHDKGAVQLANTGRAEQLVGVVGDKPLISISDSTSQVQIVTSGITPAIVSNINGDVKAGDKITPSAIDGIGMKAIGKTQVVGVAQADLSTTETRELTLNDRAGAPRKIRAGTLPVQVNVSYFSPPEKENDIFMPSFLQQFANMVAGRDVHAARIYIALIILLAGFITVGILLYSSVQSSIISIGRNPLSESAIGKSLMRVGAASLGILIATVTAIYVVLRA